MNYHRVVVQQGQMSESEWNLQKEKEFCIVTNASHSLDLLQDKAITNLQVLPYKWISASKSCQHGYSLLAK